MREIRSGLGKIVIISLMIALMFPVAVMGDNESGFYYSPYVVGKWKIADTYVFLAKEKGKEIVFYTPKSYGIKGQKLIEVGKLQPSYHYKKSSVEDLVRFLEEMDSTQTHDGIWNEVISYIENSGIEVLLLEDAIGEYTPGGVKIEVEFNDCVVDICSGRNNVKIFCTVTISNNSGTYILINNSNMTCINHAFDVTVLTEDLFTQLDKGNDTKDLHPLHPWNGLLLDGEEYRFSIEVPDAYRNSKLEYIKTILRNFTVYQSFLGFATPVVSNN